MMKKVMGAVSVFLRKVERLEGFFAFCGNGLNGRFVGRQKSYEIGLATRSEYLMSVVAESYYSQITKVGKITEATVKGNAGYISESVSVRLWKEVDRLCRLAEKETDPYALGGLLAEIGKTMQVIPYTIIKGRIRHGIVEIIEARYKDALALYDKYRRTTRELCPDLPEDRISAGC